ncbi:MAG TPA: hypothetical protein VK803_08980 [Steroidobacteraceae bacterium]|jgi:hypothetical protein|nr:hypothetical protein [Steroidobacteraceae bacterium]
MNTHSDQGLAPGARAARGARWKAAAVGIGVAVLMRPPGLQADNFSKVSYDPRTDQLVLSMLYRGTNANHTFSLQWGECQERKGSQLHEVAAEVLDDQWQDEELRSYAKTVRVSLAGIPCRPAKLTLRSAPRFLYTLLIPAVN